MEFAIILRHNIQAVSLDQMYPLTNRANMVGDHFLTSGQIGILSTSKTLQISQNLHKRIFEHYSFVCVHFYMV